MSMKFMNVIDRTIKTHVLPLPQSLVVDCETGVFQTGEKYILAEEWSWWTVSPRKRNIRSWLVDFGLGIVFGNFLMLVLKNVLRGVKAEDFDVGRRIPQVSVTSMPEYFVRDRTCMWCTLRPGAKYDYYLVLGEPPGDYLVLGETPVDYELCDVVLWASEVTGTYLIWSFSFGVLCLLWGYMYRVGLLTAMLADLIDLFPPRVSKWLSGENSDSKVDVLTMPTGLFFGEQNSEKELITNFSLSVASMVAGPTSYNVIVNLIRMVHDLHLSEEYSDQCLTMVFGLFAGVGMYSTLFDVDEFKTAPCGLEEEYAKLHALLKKEDLDVIWDLWEVPAFRHIKSVYSLLMEKEIDKWRVSEAIFKMFVGVLTHIRDNPKFGFTSTLSGARRKFKKLTERMRSASVDTRNENYIGKLRCEVNELRESIRDVMITRPESINTGRVLLESVTELQKAISARMGSAAVSREKPYGIAFTGASRAGKTTTLQVLMETFARVDGQPYNYHTASVATMDHQGRAEGLALDAKYMIFDDVGITHTKHQDCSWEKFMSIVNSVACENSSAQLERKGEFIAPWVVGVTTNNAGILNGESNTISSNVATADAVYLRFDWVSITWKGDFNESNAEPLPMLIKRKDWGAIEAQIVVKIHSMQPKEGFVEDSLCRLGARTMRYTKELTYREMLSYVTARYVQHKTLANSIKTVACDFCQGENYCFCGDEAPTGLGDYHRKLVSWTEKENHALLLALTVCVFTYIIAQVSVLNQILLLLYTFFVVAMLSMLRLDGESIRMSIVSFVAAYGSDPLALHKMQFRLQNPRASLFLDYCEKVLSSPAFLVGFVALLATCGLNSVPSGGRTGPTGGVISTWMHPGKLTPLQPFCDSSKRHALPFRVEIWVKKEFLQFGIGVPLYPLLVLPSHLLTPVRNELSFQLKCEPVESDLLVKSGVHGVFNVSMKDVYFFEKRDLCMIRLPWPNLASVSRKILTNVVGYKGQMQVCSYEGDVSYKDFDFHHMDTLRSDSGRYSFFNDSIVVKTYGKVIKGCSGSPVFCNDKLSYIISGSNDLFVSCTSVKLEDFNAALKNFEYGPGSDLPVEPCESHYLSPIKNNYSFVLPLGSQGVRTTYKQTLLHTPFSVEFFDEYKKFGGGIPRVMTKTDVEGNYSCPFYKGLSKRIILDEVFSVYEIKCVVKEVMSKVFLTEFGARLNCEYSIAYPDVSNFMLNCNTTNKMDLSTSAGPPYFKKKKRDIFSRDVNGYVTMGPEVSAEVDIILERLRNRLPVLTYVIARLKSGEVGEKGKPARIFTVTRAAMYVLNRRFFGILYKILRELVELTGCYIGINVMDRIQVEAFLKKFITQFLVDLDYAGFDARMLKIFIQSVFEELFQKIDFGSNSAEKDLILRWIEQFVWYATDFNGDWCFTGVDEPSGDFGTAEKNCLLNWILILCSVSLQGVDLNIFLQDMRGRFAFYGDDTWINVPVRYRNVLNMQSLSKTLKCFNQEVTTGAKTVILNSFSKNSDCRFLKRNFCYDDERGIFVAKLNLDSLYRPLVYYEPSKVVPDEVIFDGSSRSVLYEAYLHGKQRFEDIYAKLSKYGLPLVTYDTVDEWYRSDNEKLMVWELAADEVSV